MFVTGARKGRPVSKDGERFWDLPVHTKIISFGKQWDRLKKYMENNLYEAEGARAMLVMSSFEIYSAAPG